MGTNRTGYRLGYRGDIEGLRAVAILLVVGAHAGVRWFQGGFVGVDVFFVLSGFLITGLLVQEIGHTGRLDFPGFYIRRLKRLLPALAVMLIGAALLAAVLLSHLEQQAQASAAVSAAMWWSNIYFVSTRLDYFSGGADANIFLHTWSLGVEEQFYLVWPVLVYLLLRGQSASSGAARLRAMMVFVAVVSFVTCAVLTYSAPQFAFYMMPLRAWQFALGALLWIHFRGGLGQTITTENNGRLISALSLAGWFGLALVLGAGVFLDANHPYPSFRALIPTIGAACVIASGCHEHNRGVSRWLSFWPLQAVGRISYSWYLWHWPVLLLGRALTGSDTPAYDMAYLAVSLVLAIVSYRIVELPIRYWRSTGSGQRVAIYAALALMAAMGFGFQRWGFGAHLASENPAELQFTSAHGDAPSLYGFGCAGWVLSDQVRTCAFGSSHPKHTVVLVGDSVAAQWFTAVATFFNRPDWNLVVLTKSSCPMVDEPVFYGRIRRIFTECATWRSGALSEIAKIHPDIVLVGSSASYSFTQSQWEIGSAKVVQRLSAAAGAVYVLRSTPHLPFDGPDCLAERINRPSWLNIGPGCAVVSKDKQYDLVYEWTRQVATRFSNVRVLDMNDLVCPKGICTALRGNIIVFRDAMHISATFAESLAAELGQRLSFHDQQLLKAKSELNVQDR
jgi:peptidoglycan/LPS O-acetylase OafA/YrhL